MPLLRTPAVILHAFPYGDTSRILRLLTPNHGLVSVIAKGARAPKGRFGGILEPFTEGEAQFNLRAGRDLHTLSDFHLLRSRQAIGRDLGSFSGASVIAEVMLRFGTEEANPEIYEVVVDAFDRLATERSDPTGTALRILWHLVALFGYRPEMERCVRCGRELEVKEASRFDPDAGGVACLSCRPVGRTVSAEHRDALSRMTAGGDALPSALDHGLQASLLHAYLAAHLFHGQPLRSLPLFLEQARLR